MKSLIFKGPSLLRMCQPKGRPVLMVLIKALEMRNVSRKDLCPAPTLAEHMQGAFCFFNGSCLLLSLTLLFSGAIFFLSFW